MTAELQTAIEHWKFVNPLLSPIDGEERYLEAQAALDYALDNGGADEHNPLASLAHILGSLIADYEGLRRPMPIAASGADALRYLMEERGLKQADLSFVGSQSRVSEILSGKRKINLRQAAALASYFKVGIEAFVD